MASFTESCGMSGVLSGTRFHVNVRASLPHGVAAPFTEDEALQGVRAVVGVADLLGAPDRAIGRCSRERDRIASVILPVVGAGLAIQGAGALPYRFLDSARHVQRLSYGRRKQGNAQQRNEPRFRKP